MDSSVSVCRMKDIVRQLNIEKDIKREPVSTVSSDLMEYCQKHFHEDFLVSQQSPNPFKKGKKDSCTVM
ncbi:guanine nucleotide-binding protein subunit gamma-like [Styela clava]